MNETLLASQQISLTEMRELKEKYDGELDCVKAILHLHEHSKVTMQNLNKAFRELGRTRVVSK